MQRSTNKVDMVIIYQQYSFLVMRKITICVLWPILDSALERQQTLKVQSNWLVSYQKPHATVSCDTIARWVRNVLQQSGVDTSVCSAPSTRVASTSAAVAMRYYVARWLVEWKQHSLETDEMCYTIGNFNEIFFFRMEHYYHITWIHLWWFITHWIWCFVFCAV